MILPFLSDLDSKLMNKKDMKLEYLSFCYEILLSLDSKYPTDGNGTRKEIKSKVIASDLTQDLKVKLINVIENLEKCALVELSERHRYSSKIHQYL